MKLPEATRPGSCRTYWIGQRGRAPAILEVKRVYRGRERSVFIGSVSEEGGFMFDGEGDFLYFETPEACMREIEGRLKQG